MFQIIKIALLFSILFINGCGKGSSNTEELSESPSDTVESVNTSEMNLSLQNVFDSEKQLTVEAQEKLKLIRGLIDDATKGNQEDVVYITAGDSTRDSYHAGHIYWYTKRLEGFNIQYHHEAQSGIRAEDWANNTFKDLNGKCLDNAVNAATGDEGETTILEYSLGINDANKPSSSREEWKEHIKFGITEFQRYKPKAHIFLVVPVTTASTTTGEILKEIYLEISEELKLPLLNQERVLQEKFENPQKRVKFYYDNTHPNHFGAIRLMDYIMYQITGSEAKKVIVWDSHEFSDTTSDRGNLAENAKVVHALWNTTLGLQAASDNFRSLEEINVIGNTLLKVEHYGNYGSTVVMDHQGKVVGRFDLGKHRYPNALEEDDPYEYLYLYLPAEAASIGININNEVLMEYNSESHPIVEYVTDGLVNISQLDEIHEDLDIEHVGTETIE